MKALLILSCSATKRHDAGGLPAIDRYDGPAFRVLRKALRERAGLADALAIRILSAEFGLISADTPIPDYDRLLTRERADELLRTTRPALAELWPAAFVFASARYRILLPPPPWPVSIRVAYGGQGERLGKLRAWLWGLPL